MTALRPSSLDEATGAEGTMRAGGTDLEALRRLGLVDDGATVDLDGIAALRGIDRDGAGWRIGAMERVSAVATHSDLGTAYPGLVATAGSLANPHIRQVATVGGSLLQRTRCPYFRHRDVTCVKSGATGCPAREGDHHHGVVFDRGPCIAPHPSSIGMALLAHDAQVTVHNRADRSIDALYGDGSDPTRDHQLEAGGILTGVRLGTPVPGERAAYWRTNSRFYAEWPLVEALARVVVEDGVVSFARVAVGGVAPVPLNLAHVSEAIEGTSGDGVAIEHAASCSADAAEPLPGTVYKVELLRRTVYHVLEAAITATAHTETATHERGLP